MKNAARFRLRALLCSALFTLIPEHLAHAAETPGLGSVIVEDYKHVFTAPTRWEAQDWKNAGWAALAVAGVSFVADAEVRDYMRKQPRGNDTHDLLNKVENFGQTYAFGLMGGYYLAGAITSDEKTVQVSQDLIAASMISATINQTIKTSTSRYRPRDNQGTRNFQGYTVLNNNTSFASGHATEAFTLAAVFASHYEAAWVSYAAYSTAGLVAVARMYNDAHFASDVTASALIGTLVGKSVVSHNRSFRGNQLVLLPMFGPDLSGVQLVGNF